MTNVDLFFAVVLNVMAFIASFYLLIVGFCITSRMSKRTPFLKRTLVISATCLGLAGIVRTVATGLSFTHHDLALMVLAIVVSFLLKFLPRLKV